MVYERKVVTTAIGKMVFTAVIVLLGIHFMYHIEYNPIVREVMELLQENVFLFRKERKLVLRILTSIGHSVVLRINS